MAKVRRRRNRSKKEIIRHMAMERAIRTAGLVNGRIELIQSLVPLGLEAVNAELQAEVARLVGGSAYERTGSGLSRWGSNPGSVCLGGQKVGVEVPRVRDLRRGREIPLEAYRELQKGAKFDERVFRQLINGMSAGRYEEAAELVPETFGVSKSSVSRRFKRATGQKLRELHERDLSGYDIVAMFIDGKHLSETDMVIAQGITLEGKKVLLGFIETSTENASVCRDFVKGLVGRGLKVDQEILCVIDGAPGIERALKDVLGEKAIIQRCQWHKRENVLSYLPKTLQGKFRMKLQAAYEQPTYEKAKARLMTIRKELQLINESAVASLDEGLEQTLTLHRLGLFKELGQSFKTTNCIENVNRGVQRCAGRVCRWRNSNQRQRWLASALLELERKLRRVSGYQFLQLLRERMGQRPEVKLRKAA